MLDEELDRQPALHLELAVDALPRLLQHLAGEIGGQNVDAPSGELALHVLETHGERIRLLAGGSGGAPDADRARRPARRHQRRHDDVAEMLERYLVAEEERFVGHHRFDDRGHQRLVVAEAERLHQIAEAGKAGLARDRQQPALDQILLFGRQHEAGAVLQAAAQIIVIMRRHVRPPANSRSILGAISLSGSTAEHNPACATERGMPQTTLVASSWAITLPPAATISAAPWVPSVPMPVRTSASALAPHTAAAEENNGSTDGLQKLIGGSSPSAILMPSRSRTTRIWRPPGAT